MFPMRMFISRMVMHDITGLLTSKIGDAGVFRLRKYVQGLDLT